MSDLSSKTLLNIENERRQFIETLSDEEKNQLLITQLMPEGSKRSSFIDTDDNYIPPNLSLSSELERGPIIMTDYGAHKVGDWRHWCGCNQPPDSCNSRNHGKASIAVDYNVRTGPGFYHFIVYLRMLPLKNYMVMDTDGEIDKEATWDRFKNPGRSTLKLWQSGVIYGANSIHRSGSFYTGSSDMKDGKIGTIGIEVYHVDCKNPLAKPFWWALWDFHGGWEPNNWGNEWLRCGHELNFWFEDYGHCWS